MTWFSVEKASAKPFRILHHVVAFVVLPDHRLQPQQEDRCSSACQRPEGTPASEANFAADPWLLGGSRPRSYYRRRKTAMSPASYIR